MAFKRSAVRPRSAPPTTSQFPAVYTVNVLMAPLLLSLTFAFALVMEADQRTQRAAPAAAFIAGVFLGFGALTRLSVIFLVPGFVVLLWSATWRKSLLTRVFPFGWE